ncbi:MAG: hypothetical protein MUO97_04200, partial [Dehalococcoidia bacterium]|nr:hypothetical protein [Dehalococcoidia bacterium]
NLSQLLSLRERISGLDKVLRQAAEALTIEHKLIQAKLADKETKFARAHQLEEALAQARKRLLKLTEQEEAVVKKRRQAQRIASQISYLESTGTRLDEEIVDLNEKLKLLARGDVSCPLCETKLGVDGKQRIEIKLTSEAEQKIKAQQNNNEELSKKGQNFKRLRTN